VCVLLLPVKLTEVSLYEYGNVDSIFLKELTCICPVLDCLFVISQRLTVILVLTNVLCIIGALLYCFCFNFICFHFITYHLRCQSIFAAV